MQKPRIAQLKLPHLGHVQSLDLTVDVPGAVPARVDTLDSASLVDSLDAADRLDSASLVDTLDSFSTQAVCKTESCKLEPESLNPCSLPQVLTDSAVGGQHCHVLILNPALNHPSHRSSKRRPFASCLSLANLCTWDQDATSLQPQRPTRPQLASRPK